MTRLGAIVTLALVLSPALAVPLATAAVVPSSFAQCCILLAITQATPSWCTILQKATHCTPGILDPREGLLVA